MNIDRRAVLGAAMALPAFSVPIPVLAPVQFAGGRVLDWPAPNDGVRSIPAHEVITGVVFINNELICPGRGYTMAEWERCNEHDEPLIKAAMLRAQTNRNAVKGEG